MRETRDDKRDVPVRRESRSKRRRRELYGVPRDETLPVVPVAHLVLVRGDESDVLHLQLQRPRLRLCQPDRPRTPELSVADSDAARLQFMHRRPSPLVFLPRERLEGGGRETAEQTSRAAESVKEM